MAIRTQSSILARAEDTAVRDFRQHRQMAGQRLVINGMTRPLNFSDSDTADNIK
jgi:hypothetical protein